MNENVNVCPDCGSDLEYNSGHYICLKCEKKFSAEYFCDECGEKVERIAACGAASYFCHKCNALKSKSKVTKNFRENSAKS